MIRHSLKDRTLNSTLTKAEGTLLDMVIKQHIKGLTDPEVQMKVTITNISTE